MSESFRMHITERFTCICSCFACAVLTCQHSARQVKATEVTISKAAILATLVQRQQASDLVWSIYTAHNAGDKHLGLDSQMDVLRAVCAAPPAGSEGESRITLLLESCMAAEPGRGTLRRAVTAGMSAASASPTTVLFLKQYLLTHGQEVGPEMKAMISRATAKCERRRLLGTLSSPLTTARKVVGAALRRPQQMCARVVEAVKWRGDGALASDAAAVDRQARKRGRSGEGRDHDDPPWLSMAPVASTLVAVVVAIAGAGGGGDAAKFLASALGNGDVVGKVLQDVVGKSVGAVLSTFSGWRGLDLKSKQEDPAWFGQVQWADGGRRRRGDADAEDGDEDN